MKNIVLCVDLDQTSIDTLKNAHQDIVLKHNTVHLIHVFPIQIYNSDLIPYVFPIEEQHPAIEASTKTILEKLGADLGIEKSNLMTHCFFARETEERIKEYLISSKADLAVVATRGKHGLSGFLNNSLTDYLCKYSPCDVLVLRPKH